MNSYANYSSIPLSIAVTLDNAAVDLSAYAVNTAIDGSQGTPAFKILVTVINSGTGSAVTTEDGLNCSGLTAFRGPDSTVKNIAVLTLRKGFNFTADTPLTAIAWYDSTSGRTGGWRECGRFDFKISMFNNGGVTPPYS